jgi:hypothetical protein
MKKLDEKQRKLLVILVIAAVVVIAGITAIVILTKTSNTDRISFNQYTYVNTKIQVDINDSSKEFTIQYRTAVDTGKKVKGMRVFAAATNSEIPPVLFLVGSDRIVWVYVLAGGE